MWFEDQVMFPRILRSFLWTIVIQESYLSLMFLILKVISWNPFSGFIDWLFYMIHWKSLFYKFVLCMTTIGFGALNRRFFAAEKHICSTRFEKICRALSPLQVQHFFVTAFLGGLVSYCCIGLFQNLDLDKTTLLSSFLYLENDFEHSFVIQHGCYTGIMLSLKYFICCLYLVKLSLTQETKVQHIKHQLVELAKDSAICVLKAMHWYYLLYIICGPLVKNVLRFVGFKLSTSESLLDSLYSLINLQLFLVTLITGFVIFFNWSLYLTIFNAHAAERHIFPIEMPVKSTTNKSLSAMLVDSQSDILKYLAMLDLRLLSQHDPQRRKQIFAISHPGGHPHQWKAISDFCIASLKEFVNHLNEYCVTVAGKESKMGLSRGSLTMERQGLMTESIKVSPSLSKKVVLHCRGWQAVAYFLDELPSTKIRQLFASCQPLIWMTEALGYLVAASYSEDKFGVIQQTLPTIIRLLLDIKIAEEKLPIDLVGIRTHVKDPQGRYEHIHQRVALKTSVHTSLCRIADTFKNDINGIYLPEEYYRYFQRYLNRKNV